MLLRERQNCVHCLQRRKKIKIDGSGGEVCWRKQDENGDKMNEYPQGEREDEGWSGGEEEEEERSLQPYSIPALTFSARRKRRDEWS